MSGDGEIRTRDTPFRVCRFSKPVVSATHPRHRMAKFIKNKDQIMVGVAGFEPAAPCSQSRCANRTAPHPELALLRSDCKGKILFCTMQE